MQRIGLFAAWLLATLVATAGAWQVVGAAESEVFDAPLTPVIAISSTTATTPRETVSTFETPSTVADPVPGSTPTTIEGAGSGDGTSSAPQPTYAASGDTSSVSSTTSPSPSTTRSLGTGVPTTNGPGDGGEDGDEPDLDALPRIAVPTSAGTVTVAGNDDGVFIVAVLATPGWSYEVEDPERTDRVRVRFDRGSSTIRVEVRWNGEQLVAVVDTD